MSVGFRFLGGLRTGTPAPLTGRDLNALCAVGREHTMIPSEVDPGFGEQCREAGDEIERFEHHMGGAVTVRRFELVTYPPHPWAVSDNRCSAIAGRVM